MYELKQVGNLNFRVYLDCEISVFPQNDNIVLKSFLNYEFKIDNHLLRLHTHQLIPLLKSLDMLDFFKESSLKEIERLQKYFIEFKDEKTIKSDMLLKDKDIYISSGQNYYEIFLCNENGRDKLVDRWKEYLDKL
jgi:hypothetical protein